MSEAKGILFNIVHGSMVDGPGVRTTVFLKGCPLRCLWCCNSEGQFMNIELKVEKELCTACGRCYEICPEDAIRFSDGKITGIDREKCTMCMKCVKACYLDAIDTFGKEYTVDEVFEEVCKDSEYYEETGGGVTIGGGEPTLQPEFTGALMEKLQAKGIHVALDTCGYTASEKSRELLDRADLLLFDVKGLDPASHQRDTGVSNEIILKNLQHRNELGKPVIIRMPIIPGHNDSDESIQAEARMLSELGCIIRVDIIAYHDYGKIKFEQRGYAYPLEGTEKLSEERVAEIKRMLESYGLKVQIGG